MAEVAVEDVCDAPVTVGLLEAAVAGLAVAQVGDAPSVAREGDDADGEVEVLHVCGLFELELVRRVAQQPFPDIWVVGGFSRGAIHELQALPVVSEHVEKLILAHDLIDAHHAQDVVGQAVVHAPGDVLIAVSARQQAGLHDSVLVEDRTGLFHLGGGHVGGRVGGGGVGIGDAGGGRQCLW